MNDWKWISVGASEAISDEEGKVLGHIEKHAPNSQVKKLVKAYADGKFLGLYIDDALARVAVMSALGRKRNIEFERTPIPRAEDHNKWR